MSKRDVLLGFLLCAFGASAQMASWIIEPKYDSIQPTKAQNILVSDSAGITAIWDIQGKKLYSTPEVIHPFAEDKAVITKKGTDKILGFIDTKGNFTALPESEVAYDYPYFSDGLLCVKSGRGYGYYSAGGDNSQFLFFDTAYPFSKGYAVYLSYGKPDVKKDPYFNYNYTTDKSIEYKLDNKNFDFRNIDFLSSVADDNRAIAVIKNKVYWFNAANGTFSPMCGGGVDDKKNQVQIDGKVVETLSRPSEKLHFNGKYGKGNIVQFSFDKLLRPDTIIMDDRAITFPKAKESNIEYKTNLSLVEAAGKKGININGITVLPPQFKNTGLMYDDNAVVEINGKYGVVKVIKDAPYSFVMNEGNDIGFRHNTFETQLRLDLPKELSSNSIDFDVPSDAGIRLDKRFSEAKDTRAGNYLVYKCVLTIPNDLSAELTDITYPITVSYNGLVFPEHPLTVKGWHLKSYTVDVDEEDITLLEDGAIFSVDITALRKAGDNDYPFTVETKSDNLTVFSEKISETRYKYNVTGLENGKNHIDIVVTEKGCPAITFPFEIDYTKPSKRNKAQLTVSKKEGSGSVENQGDATPAAETQPQATPESVAPTQTENQTPMNVSTPVTSTSTYIPEVPVEAPAQSTETDSIKNANLMRLIQ